MRGLEIIWKLYPPFFHFCKPPSHANLEKGPSHPPKGTFAPIGLQRKLKRLDQDASGASSWGKIGKWPSSFLLSYYYDYGGSTRTCCPQTKGRSAFCPLCLGTFLSKSYWRWLHTRNPLPSLRKRYFLECLVTRVLRRARVSSFQAILLLLKSQNVRNVMDGK